MFSVIPTFFSNFAAALNVYYQMKLFNNTELAHILDQDIFHIISSIADKLGVECYVVGGYVRDIFLQRKSNDIDVVVVGSGIQIATELKNSLGKNAHDDAQDATTGVYENLPKRKESNYTPIFM